MCELHFHAHEIKKSTSVFDKKTGKVLKCSLQYPKLQPEAIPSQFPMCSSYLSKPCGAPRLSKSQMLQQKEESQLAKAIQKSKEMREKEEKDLCKSLNEMCEKLKLKDPWKIVQDEANQFITIFTLHNSDSVGPQVEIGLTIDKDFSLKVYINSVRLHEIGKKVLPFKCDRVSIISDVCDTAILPILRTESLLRMNHQQLSWMHCA